MEVNAEDIEERSCNRRFRFREKIYESNREVTMPIVIRVGNGDFIRKNIAMSVIDREEELFLCGLKTLGD